MDYRVPVERAGDMKAFYGGGGETALNTAVYGLGQADNTDPIDTYARVAVYDSASAAPYVEDIGPAPAAQLIETLTVRVYELSRQRGGEIPYTVIREVAENLIHAGFAEPVVSVLDSGSTIRFTDQGPGIPDKMRALQPGFTTARAYMKGVIRGVGSGLPIVSDFLSVSGGSLSIEDNLCGGTVVTISAATAPTACVAREDTPRGLAVTSNSEDSVTYSTPRTASSQESSLSVSAASASAPSEERLFAEDAAVSESACLTTRQKQVMALVLESGAAGPSVVSRELGVGLSTAYRDLASLEDLGLIVSDGGKRRLTDEGVSLLGDLSSRTHLSSL